MITVQWGARKAFASETDMHSPETSWWTLKRERALELKCSAARRILFAISHHGYSIHRMPSTSSAGRIFPVKYDISNIFSR